MLVTKNIYTLANSIQLAIGLLSKKACLFEKLNIKKQVLSGTYCQAD